jgi:hypothetical protein
MHIEVLVSYARKDIDRARQVVSKLEQDGQLIVWWDQRMPFAPDSSFAPIIDDAIRAAQCVVVLWSAHSRPSQWVRAEVDRAARKDRRKLIHVCLDDDPPALPYTEQRSIRIDEGDPKTFVELLDAVKSVIGIHGPNEHVVRPRLPGERRTLTDLAIDGPVPGTDTFVSFRPFKGFRGQDPGSSRVSPECRHAESIEYADRNFTPPDASGVFLLLRINTSDGWVDSRVPTALERHHSYQTQPNVEYCAAEGVRFVKVPNEIYLINDPLRPFTIQIGGLRSQRPSATPGIILGDKISLVTVEALALNMQWMSMTLAEILSTEDALAYLSEMVACQSTWSETDKKGIQALIGRNPYAPRALQQNCCVFCDEAFRQHRRLSTESQEKKHGAYIIANDYPFGPFFHYLAITSEPVHTWEEVTYQQLLGLNMIIHEFFQDKSKRGNAAGIELGFNSSARHLILGRKTHSSAGASIPHIHKQAWGLIPRSANIAEQLIQVSQAYCNEGIDYLECYRSALKESGYEIWSDENVFLYVPYGQCSKFELQAMIAEPCGTYTDLTADQIISLSKAEYIALSIFKDLEIGSFNQVFLTKLYGDNRAPKFRLIEAFITREVDLAASELSMLYVVDQHPWAARNHILERWEGKAPTEGDHGSNGIRRRVLDEIST